MNDLFHLIVSISLSGSLLMFVLLFIRTICKRWTNQCWRYYIWLVIVVRLLLPFAPQTSMIKNSLQQITSQTKKTDTLLSPNTAPLFILPEPNNESAQNIEIDKVNEFSQNLGTIWFVIALIVFVRKITIYQSFVKYVKAGSSPVTDIELLEELGKSIDKEKIKIPVELYVNNLISSPVLMGFIHPCIVLPTTNLSTTDFSNCMMHELTHYKCKDMFYKWLVQITVCLHWFNPLVHFMNHLISRDCELACDEAVIQNLDVVERCAYGNTLLNMAYIGGNFKDSLAATALNESKELLQERLDAIMKFKKTSKIFIFTSLFITLLLVCSFTYVSAIDLNTSTNNTQKIEKESMEHCIIKGNIWFFIENETQLRSIGDDAERLSNRYLLMNSIDLTDDWEPIGTADAPFTGVFDGNGNSLHGLTITDQNAEIIGLFGYAKGATFHNIELTDVDIMSAGSNTENRQVDPVCAVPVDCEISDIRIYETNTCIEPVEIDTLDIKDKTYYLVHTEEQLRAIASGQYGMDKNFLQQTDIELSTDEWIPIGTFDNPFTGSYTGNGFEIKGLTMKDPYAQIIGLFGVAEGAHIYNVTLRDYDILSAGSKASIKGIAPVLVYGTGTKSYDNYVFPIEE